ncbi:DUF2524 family protein [Thalassobacillus devorans]|uniref:DUF2524 family protein n=2 Tax=Thalassobacillus TaxID=331971 RepID=UPI0020CB42EA|nr:DUF2524 family protein [Thalassobacillus devorans]
MKKSDLTKLMGEVIAMATRESIETMIQETKQRLEQAKYELSLANQNGYPITASYTEAQQGLEQTEMEIDKLMHSANHQQKDQLHRLHLQVSQCLNDMILDENDLEHR